MVKTSEPAAGFGTVTIDNLILRKALNGKIVLLGSLDVSLDATFRSNVEMKQDLDVMGVLRAPNLVTDQLQVKNITVDGNVSIKGDHLTVDNNVEILGSLSAYNNIMFGNTAAYMYSTNIQNIGINTDTATSTLDIYGENARSLNVYSSKPTNFNIIARNNQNKGIAVFSNTTTSYLGFYNNKSIGETDISINTPTPDAKIQYTSSGVLSIDVSKNTNILSRVSITPSPTNPVEHPLNETLVTYGASSTTPYLWNSLEKYNIQTSSTSTFVSYDNSTNTFINVITPAKTGVSIGGGTYINDSARSFGTVGLLTASGQYYPALNIVSGKSNVKQKFTVGINTHSPTVDTYTVDVNGPIKLTNGEMTVTYRAKYQILSMAFSRNDPNVGVAVGTPYLLPSTDPMDVGNPDKQINPHQIIYTIDGGNSWDTSTITDPGLTNAVNNFQDVYIYDVSLAIWVGESNQLYMNYTNPRYISLSWPSQSPPSPLDTEIQDSIDNSSYSSIFINNSKRVFISNTDDIIFHFDVSGYNDKFYVDTTGSVSVSVIPLYTGSNNTGIIQAQQINNVSQIRGYAQKLYVIGSQNKIQVWGNINTNTPTLDRTRQISDPSVVKTCNSIYVYDDDTAVVVGTNVISYTNDGGMNWFDVTDISQNFTLNSVYMYNRYMSIAVGNGGLVMKSSDGNKTWQIMSPDVLRSSGNSGLLIDASYNLTNIAIPDINTFLITKTVNVYDNADSTATKTTGDSSIFYCNYPYLFNNPQNYVLDVFGSSRYSGDINIIDGGKLQSTNNTFDLLKTNVKNLYFGNEANVISIGNPTNSMVTHNYDFTVLHDSCFNGNVAIHQNATITGNVLMQSKLTVVDDVLFNSNLRVNNTTYLNDRLYVQKDVFLRSNLFVDKDTALTGELQVGGNVRFARRFDVVGDVSFNANIQVDKITYLNDRLYVQKDVFLRSNLLVTKDTALTGELQVGGNVRFAKRLDVVGDVSFNANLQVDKITYLNDRLYVQNDVFLRSNLFVEKDTALTGELQVGGNVQLAGRLDVVGDVSFNANLQVDKTTYLNDELYVQKDVFMESKLTVSNDAAFNENVTVQKVLRAETFESIDPTKILIGSIGLYAPSGDTVPIQNIYIGTNDSGAPQRTKNTITIGGGEDTIILGGKAITMAIQNIGVGKTLTLNKDVPESSVVGSGIFFADGSNSDAGYVLVSSDKNGYVIKPPGQQNTITLDISAIVNPMKNNSSITNGFLTLSKRTTTFGSLPNYIIGVGQIDISNVLLKKYSATDSVTNIQNIDTNLGINGNVYARRSMAIGKTTILPNVALDISGSISHNNGYIWQF